MASPDVGSYTFYVKGFTIGGPRAYIRVIVTSECGETS